MDNDLSGYIERQNLEFCNVQTNTADPAQVIFQPNPDLGISSDCDDQLLINIPFQSPVKVASLKIRASKSSLENGSAPKTLRLYVNRGNMDFNSLSGVTVDQDIHLTKEQLQGAPVSLRFVKFQNVRSLSMLFDGCENPDESETVYVGTVALFGAPESVLNMQDWTPGDQQQES